MTWVPRRMKGREMERFIVLARERSGCSYSVWRDGLLVSLRSFSALAWSSLGGLCEVRFSMRRSSGVTYNVSRRKNRPNTWIMASAIDVA